MTDNRTLPNVTLVPFGNSKVSHVMLGDLQIGVIVGGSDGMWQAATGMISPVDKASDYAKHATRTEAVDDLLRRYDARRQMASSLRAVRPANPAGSDLGSRKYADGYNDALRDFEAVLLRLVGPALRGEGYTATTGNQDGRSI